MNDQKWKRLFRVLNILLSFCAGMNLIVGNILIVTILVLIVIFNENAYCD
jgi:uncharacterized membrane protein HdeD (DUF308 family)